MKSLLTSALLCIFLIGCQSQSNTRKYWYRPDTTLEQAIKDCKACKESARGDAQAGHYDRYRDRLDNSHPTPYNDALERADRDAENLHSFRSSMRQLGYKPVLERHLGSELRKTHCWGGSDIQYIAGK